MAGIDHSALISGKKSKPSTQKKKEDTVEPKNHSYGWIGTHKLSDKDHSASTKEWAPHVKKHLEDALKRHQANDAHFHKVTGTTTTSAKVRAGLKVDNKTVAHFLDSTHGRHLAHHSVAGKKPTDPKVADELKKRASEFTRSYHPSQFDESVELTNLISDDTSTVVEAFDEGDAVKIHAPGYPNHGKKGYVSQTSRGFYGVADKNGKHLGYHHESHLKRIDESSEEPTTAQKMRWTAQDFKKHYDEKNKKTPAELEHERWERKHNAPLKEDGLEDACWKGYEAIGTKKKNGKTVPNCVKEEQMEIEESQMFQHRMGVTISDPHHINVTKRKEQIQKTVRVNARDKDHAHEVAKAFYKKKGYKVHDTWHIEQLKEESINEAKADKNHPIYKEYQSLKTNHSLGELRNKIKQMHKVVDVSGFNSKDHAASHIVRHRHGDKKVATAFGLAEDISTKRADRKAVTTTKPDGTRETKWVRTSQRDIVKEAMALIAESKLINEEYSSHEDASAALERHKKKFPSANLSITKGSSGKFHVMKHTSGGSSRVTA